MIDVQHLTKRRAGGKQRLDHWQVVIACCEEERRPAFARERVELLAAAALALRVDEQVEQVGARAERRQVDQLPTASRWCERVGLGA